MIKLWLFRQLWRVRSALSVTLSSRGVRTGLLCNETEICCQFCSGEWWLEESGDAVWVGGDGWWRCTAKCRRNTGSYVCDGKAFHQWLLRCRCWLVRSCAACQGTLPQQWGSRQGVEECYFSKGNTPQQGLHLPRLYPWREGGGKDSRDGDETEDHQWASAVSLH